MTKQRKSLPSSKVGAAKAKEILRHGEVQGHPLTAPQRGMFGAAAGRAEKKRKGK